MRLLTKLVNYLCTAQLNKFSAESGPRILLKIIISLNKTDFYLFLFFSNCEDFHLMIFFFSDWTLFNRLQRPILRCFAQASVESDTVVRTSFWRFHGEEGLIYLTKEKIIIIYNPNSRLIKIWKIPYKLENISGIMFNWVF